jgi:predicted amidohydrolase
VHRYDKIHFVQLDVLIAQVPAVRDVDANLATLRRVLDDSRPGEVVLLPEGALSGYDENLVLTNAEEVLEAIRTAAALAGEYRVHLLCGSLLPAAGGWYNAALYLSPDAGPLV